MGNLFGHSSSQPSRVGDDVLEGEFTSHPTTTSENYDSFWTQASRAKLTEVEKKFFHHALTISDPDNRNPIPNFTQTIVGSLGTIKIEDKSENSHKKPAMVLVHGYASSNSFWSLVIRALAPHFRLYLVELHGHGRSDRTPEFPSNLSALEAEDYMAEYIEKWRKESDLGDEKFFLVGHSLGAMVSWRYAAKYEHRLRHLILLSPVGVPTQPPNLEERLANAPLFFRFLISRWKSGTSPMDIIRSFGPFGMTIVRSAVRRRMKWMPAHSAFHKVDFEAFCEIIHQSWALPANGERAMNAMLVPGAYAKEPLLGRAQQDLYGPQIPHPSLPISLIYGDPEFDWMTPSHGKTFADILSSRTGSKYVGFQEVPGAGHLVCFDNPTGFVELLMKEVRSAGTL
eukprot:c14478_g1_i1.p1 GENE.c14478_g1_i1~~c14478_g1_i1.p1  ORF type:complete len:398 (+),score=160.68 c14478_g1_i1:82-1275(+)